MLQAIQILRRSAASSPLPRQSLLFRSLSSQKATLGQIDLQLDYYMGSQFAGIAVAQSSGLYEKHGLKAVNIRPPCDPGLEPYVIIDEQQRTANDSGTTVCVGTIEQNVLFPCVAKDGVDVSAVAAMLRSCVGQPRVGCAWWSPRTG